jgi:hypothetical protein
MHIIESRQIFLRAQWRLNGMQLGVQVDSNPNALVTRFSGRVSNKTIADFNDTSTGNRGFLRAIVLRIVKLLN